MFLGQCPGFLLLGYSKFSTSILGIVGIKYPTQSWTVLSVNMENCPEANGFSS